MKSRGVENHAVANRRSLPAAYVFQRISISEAPENRATLAGCATFKSRMLFGSCEELSLTHGQNAPRRGHFVASGCVERR